LGIADNLGIELSTNVKARHVKIMFWGATATWKTETVIRNFPHVLVVDIEGNTDQIDRDEVPPFLVAKTKDARKAIEIVDAVAAGKIKFPDGSLVETLTFDSISVLWGVQQEVASKLAENRAARYNRPADEATTTQLDWGVAKRPIKTIQNRTANSPIKYLIFIARQKDLYEEKEPGDTSKKDQQKKIGYTFDATKGLDYEMNLACQFLMKDGKWSFVTTKVQGRLKKWFPLGKEQSKFPMAELIAYANDLQTGAGGEEDEEDIANRLAGNQIVKTQKDLIDYAKGKELQASDVGPALKKAGITTFDAKKWDEMKKAIDAYVTAKEKELEKDDEIVPALQ
jgi:hypothetical protein